MDFLCFEDVCQYSVRFTVKPRITRNLYHHQLDKLNSIWTPSLSTRNSPIYRNSPKWREFPNNRENLSMSIFALDSLHIWRFDCILKPLQHNMQTNKKKPAFFNLYIILNQNYIINLINKLYRYSIHVSNAAEIFEKKMLARTAGN